MTPRVFSSKAELIEAAADTMPHLDRAVALACAKSAARYVPHVCNVGWFVRGFGYSTERLGVFVGGDRAVVVEAEIMRRMG